LARACRRSSRSGSPGERDGAHVLGQAAQPGDVALERGRPPLGGQGAQRGGAGGRPARWALFVERLVQRDRARGAALLAGATGAGVGGAVVAHELGPAHRHVEPLAQLAPVAEDHPRLTQPAYPPPPTRLGGGQPLGTAQRLTGRLVTSPGRGLLARRHALCHCREGLRQRFGPLCLGAIGFLRWTVAVDRVVARARARPGCRRFAACERLS